MIMLNTEMTITNVVYQFKLDNHINNLGLWYDWFCAEDKLQKKGEKMLNKLKMIENSPRFNKDTTYVWFKNNWECGGRDYFYDDFRIADMRSGKTLYTIILRNSDGQAELWGKDNDFKEELVVGKWTDIKNYFFLK